MIKFVYVSIYTSNTGTEYVLNEGDFFVLPPNTPYASKAMADTQVLFVKTGGNDKISIEAAKEVQDWLNNLDN